MMYFLLITENNCRRQIRHRNYLWDLVHHVLFPRCMIQLHLVPNLVVIIVLHQIGCLWAIF